MRATSAALPLIRRAGEDNIPDSPATVDAGETPVRLQKSLATATAALRKPHGDWNLVDQQADQIAAEAATWRARLEGEVARAAASVSALQSAAAERRASAFSSSSGSGSSGGDSSSSRSSFSSGSGASRSGW